MNDDDIFQVRLAAYEDAYEVHQTAFAHARRQRLRLRVMSAAALAGIIVIELLLLVDRAI